MDYFYVDIETELGEMLTYYVAAMDEAHAEELATIAFENGEIECMGIQIVSIMLIGHKFLCIKCHNAFR